MGDFDRENNNNGDDSFENFQDFTLEEDEAVSLEGAGHSESEVLKADDAMDGFALEDEIIEDAEIMAHGKSQAEQAVEPEDIIEEPAQEPAQEPVQDAEEIQDVEAVEDIQSFDEISGTEDSAEEDIVIGADGGVKDEDESGEQLPEIYEGQQVDTRTTDIKEQESSIRQKREDIRRRASEVNQKDGSDAAEAAKGRMGERLVALGVITEDQLQVALQEKKITGKLLGEVLVDLSFIDEETLSAVLSEASGFDVFDPSSTIVDGEALTLIEKDVALKHYILPVSIRGSDVKVAMSDPYDVLAMDTLRQYLPKGANIVPMVTTPSILSDAIDAAYGYASSINAILQELENVKDDKAKTDVTGLNENEAYSHPIVRLVNALVFDAVKIGASDLHFEPEENFVRLRYRVDGVLYTAQILHRQFWNGISQRIKIMSNMDIADKLQPQDGRFGLNVGGRDVDFRVSSLPTVFGENIVLRVLDKSLSIMPLDGLGFSEENMEKIKAAQSRPEGIIIVTGPTGSGKTTSLYSMLNEINNVEVNIKTLEDPVEYSLPMIRQTHVREGVLEFADGIKSILRQDPDIIFIGEIRDGETANMALKAAMTGHQVYTTLHTNDSFGALPRLFDLGLVPGMVAGSIIAVFAQRLTRRLCEYCRESYTPDAAECEILGVNASNPPQVYRAKQGGCEMCKGQGYKGRIAVAEILTMDEELDDSMAKGATKAELRALAKKKGFKSMKDDGILKVLEGVTTLEALSRVVNINE